MRKETKLTLLSKEKGSRLTEPLTLSIMQLKVSCIIICGECTKAEWRYWPMKNCFEYKDYHAKVEYDYESKVLFGVIDGIQDLVTFESDSAGGIEEEFHNAVDDYLDFCKEVGKEPEKEYKGTFNVRINPELHKNAAHAAYKLGVSLNQYVAQAIADKLVHQT